MADVKSYYHRNLPHYQPSNAMFFITFRIANALPKDALVRLNEEREQMKQNVFNDSNVSKHKKHSHDLHKRYFGKFDRLLDGATTGPHWLSDSRVAKTVVDAIHYRDSKEYELIAYSIMPNHVHMVITVERSDTSLYRILQSLKAYTAKEANKILNRNGAFWQNESYDHVVRDEKELGNIIWYILNNPVKAGFAKEWKEWKWSYCKYDIGD